MSETVSGEELEKINGYAREPLTEDKVFVFRVALCDNDIDRDGEKFSSGALEKLAELMTVTELIDFRGRLEKQAAENEEVYKAERESFITGEYKL